MKTVCKGILFVVIASCIFTGCATRVGNSSKYGSYNDKLNNIIVVYTKVKNDEMPLKLKKSNFDKFDDYLSKSVTPIFTSAGIRASYIANPAEKATLPGDKRQLLVITPLIAFGTVGSQIPAKIKFDVSVFDSSINKKVWRADFYVVIGGFLYDDLSEKVTSDFLIDIIEKLQDDGLVAKL